MRAETTFISRTAIASETGLVNIGCQSGGYKRASSPKPNFEVAADPQFPKVVLAHNEDHAQALSSALDAIGGIGRFVKKGERVLLKPNVAFDRVPEQAVNTNPILVGEMTRLCRLAGASEIMVTDYGTQSPSKTFVRSGIKRAVEQHGGHD